VREDMARVIVERPRIVDSFTRKGRVRPLEELPKRLGMRRSQRERGGYKTLNENLAPLRRFLERQVGRPWDKVYSEIAARLRADNTVQQHVRDHLKDFVATRPLRAVSTWRRWGDESLWYQPLYVDPRDGILRRTDRLPDVRVRRRKEAEQHNRLVSERVELSDTSELRRIDGMWYAVSLAPLPEPEYQPVTGLQRVALKPYDRNSPVVEMEVMQRRLVSPPVFDAVRQVSVRLGPEIDEEAAWRQYRRDHPDRRYAVAKRQLCRKELQRHGLENRAEDEG
jgi:hypothetical protein